MTKASLVSRLKEAYKIAVGLKEFDLTSALGKSADIGFRRLSQKSDKELSPLEWRRQMAIAHFLWLQNPVAFRLVELMTDFVMGDGFTWEAEDESIKKILTEHWEDPDNDWENRLTQFGSELSMFGVIVLKPFINTVNGHVKLAPIDPGWIIEVVPHPHKPGVAEALRIQRLDGTTATWKIISRDNDPTSPTFNKLIGEVFYFPINKLSFTIQGSSDLFRLSDWLDAYDQFLYHTMERIVFLNSHIYDITIEDANETVVKAKVAELELNPPKAGSFRVHSDKEKWEALAPKINSAEITDIATLIKMLVFGSAGVPAHWFGDGSDANLATAKEMSAPILRKFKRRQKVWKNIIGTVFDFVIDQALIAKRPGITEKTNRSHQVIAPDLSATDVNEFITALKNLTETLVISEDAGYIDKPTAQKVWAQQASEVGVEVKSMSPEELAKTKAAADVAAKEKAEIEARQVESEAYPEDGGASK